MSASSISDEEMFAIVSGHVGATISVYDQSLTFRYVCDGFAAWFGLKPEDIVGRTLLDCYGEHNYIRYRPYIDRAIASEAVAYERQVRDASGVDGWRTVSLVPWRDDCGNVIGIVNSALDVRPARYSARS